MLSSHPPAVINKNLGIIIYLYEYSYYCDRSHHIGVQSHPPNSYPMLNKNILSQLLISRVTQTLSSLNIHSGGGPGILSIRLSVSNWLAVKIPLGAAELWVLPLFPCVPRSFGWEDSTNITSGGEEDGTS